MIIDQLFEDDKKKKLNEVDPRNFDSDEDYYAAVRRSKNKSHDDDYYDDEDEIDDMDDDESYYEKSVRTRGLAESRRYKLEESRIVESDTFKQFYQVGRMLVEYKLTDKEILDVFAQAEADMTNKGTGANRTALGRGKDTVGRGITNAKDAINTVLGNIQKSAPVAGVDVAYDKATDALANLTGGQNSKVMDSIKKYRLLAKEYPKTQLFVKTALIALAGLATGGAGLPAVAGLTAAVDAAIKGEKLSSIIGKGAGASIMGLAGQKLNAALSGNAPAQIPGDNAQAMDMMSNQGDVDAAGNLITPDTQFPNTYGDNGYGGPETAAQTGEVPASDSLAPGEEIVPPGGSTAAGLGAEGFGGGTYTVQPGDQGGYIAQANGISFPDLKGLNPQVTDWSKLQPGTELQLPPANTHTGSVWDGSATAPATAPSADVATPANPQQPTAQPFGSGPPDTSLLSTPAVRGPMGLSNTTVANMPVIPGQPLNPTQMAVADFAMQQGNKLSPVVQAAYDLAKRGAVRESVKFKTIPATELFDTELTAAIKRLNESSGIKSRSMQLTYEGVYTVIENVDRYRKAILEYTQPGREQLPDYYRPDMPGAPQPQTAQPGMVGRGLNWLDKAAKKVGGAVSNFGHQFTTGVTKEKLKMNWHQKGKPTDSNELADFLVAQGVPQQVVVDVYGKMEIPGGPKYVPAAPAGAPAAARPRKTQMGYETGLNNPATGKPWTPAELAARRNTRDLAATKVADLRGNIVKDISADPIGAADTMLRNYPNQAPQATTSVSPTATPAGAPAAASPAGWDNPQSPNYVGRREVARRQAAAPTAPAKPNFAQQGGYAQVNQPTTMKYTGMPAAKPAAKPVATPTTANSGTYNKKTGAANLGGKNMVALKDLSPELQKQLAPTTEGVQLVSATVKQVKRMLENVQTKDDVQKIKQYIDRQFTKHGLVSESAFEVRNSLIEQVVQIGAQRRREFARKSR